MTVKSIDEFRDGVKKFMDHYIDNARTIDSEHLTELKQLSDFAKSTLLYKTQAVEAAFYDYSYDDVFNHMCIKMIGAPAVAVFCAILCIPFIYDKYIHEGGM